MNVETNCISEVGDAVTSVDYVISELYEKMNITGDGRIFDSILKKAKMLEKDIAEEYAKFCVRCDRENMKLIEFSDFIKHVKSK